MTYLNKNNWIKRMSAWALAVVMLLGILPVPAFAQDGLLPEIMFTLNWKEGEEMASVMAMEVTEPGYEDSFWLYVPENALAADATLDVMDTYGQWAYLSLAGGMPLSMLEYVDAGTELGENYLEVLCYNGESQVVAQRRLYISLQTDMPMPPAPAQPVVNPVDVWVYYKDASGYDVATPTTQTCNPGENWVNAAPYDLQEGYQLQGESSQYVYVDENGANPSSVTFVYYKPVNPVDVWVYYKDGSGYDVATPTTQTCNPGENWVNAAPSDLQEGYQLQGESSQYVYVDENGANPSSVTFVYYKPVNPVDVWVYYKDASGYDVATPTTQTCNPGENWVNAAPYDLQDGYQLQGESSQYVYVDENGANPSSVTFVYYKPVNPVDVWVYYKDGSGYDVATPTTQTCNPGENWVNAAPYDLQEGYQLQGESSQYVYVDENGANPSSVTFVYYKPVNPVDVWVYYKDASGYDVATPTTQTCNPGENWVNAAPYDLQDGYQLQGESSQYVYVDENGANPSSVTFVYYKPVNPVDVWVYYKDASGYDVATPTTQTCNPGENWVNAAPYDLQEGYQLQGESSQYVYVDENGANPSSVTFVYYKPVNPVDVWVYYKDASGYDVATPTTQTCNPGENWVNAAPYDLQEGYQLQGESSQYVYVDENGANPSSVTFVYYKPVNPVDVWVYYKDASGYDVATPTTQTCNPGENWVNAAPYDLREGYQLQGESSQYVYVDENGANPSSVTFIYEPVIVTLTIPVYYYDTEGGYLNETTATVQTGSNDVYADDALVPAGYTLDSESPVVVTVDAAGACSHENVSFLYNKPAPTATPEPQPVTVQIAVFYFDEEGGYIFDEYVDVTTGSNEVWANEAMIPEGYTLESDNPVAVEVDYDGNCVPENVTFIYSKPEPTVEPTIEPTVEPEPTDTPEPQPVTVQIAVFYFDEEGGYIFDEYVDVTTGYNEVWANEAMIPEGYTLESDNPVAVEVDYDGNCVPENVTFIYSKPEPTAEPTVEPTVEPEPTDTPEPQPVTVQIAVFYFDEEGGYIFDEYVDVTTGYNEVWANEAMIPEGYTLESDNPVTVEVDYDGNCVPENVTFIYSKPEPTAEPTIEPTVEPEPTDTPEPQPVTVQIAVFYFDEEGGYIFDEYVDVTTGSNEVWANEAMIPEGFTLVSDNPVAVEVDYDGNCVPENVTFIYSKPEPTIEPTVEPTEEPTVEPTLEPTEAPTEAPTEEPTVEPTLEPTKAPTAEPVVVEVPVFYYDRKGNELARTSVWLGEGTHRIAASEDAVPDGYIFDSETPVTVVVSAEGKAEPGEVIFYYTAPQATPAPVDVTVYYRNIEGRDVASPTVVRCQAGVNPIRPAPVDLEEYYHLAEDEEEQKFVYVDENGADYPEVVFLYEKSEPTAEPTQAPTPEPKIALVPVYYRTTISEKPFYTDTTVTCLQGKENEVRVNMGNVPQGYTLVSDEVVYVTVDPNGVADPQSVTFLFTVDNLERNITVYYRTADGMDVASPQQAVCRVGENSIDVYTYAPLDLMSGYALAGGDFVMVTMDEYGRMSPESVTFIYAPIPTPPPTPTVFPYTIYDMSGYCYPKSDTINFRSEPSTASDESVIRTVNQKELGQIEGYVVNSANETWYVVSFGEQLGFIRDNRVRVLTDEEVNALFGYTPVPTATPIPDGAVIDRWALVNDVSVNFREQPGGKSLGRAAKNSKIFVYESKTVDGTKWYRANYNDKDGYMMAKFIDLMTQGESDAYQKTLENPMPVRTPVPTIPPTSTPTVEPTQAPVTATPTVPPTKAPTATPEPYAGYALTTRAVDLRTGVTVSDTTLATLPAGTLVYLWGQAYIDGQCWHSAEALAAGAAGYLPDTVVQRISAEEAAPYLAAMKPSATATPTPTAQPEPYTGYAVAKGNNVMIRNFPDEMAEIAQRIQTGDVVWVMGQEYVPGSSHYWEVVRYGNVYGYVRADQLQVMTEDEQKAFEEALRTPTPAPAATATVPPVSNESMSSYGYVTTNNVRLRSGAGMEHGYIRMMNQYAFALVLGTEVVDGKTWYHINQSGTEGYVMGDYFKVLSLGELTEFLTSDEYKEATQEQDGTQNSGTLTSPEDFNADYIWKYPQATASYEPFSNLIASPTPNVEQVATQQPTATPTIAPLPTTNFEPYSTPQPNAKGGGNGGMWLGIGLGAAVIGLGGAYVASVHRKNQRRAAQRAAQQRQKQAQQQARMNANAYARPTQQNAQRPAQPSPYTPPTPGQNAQNASAAPQQQVRRRRSDRHQG